MFQSVSGEVDLRAPESIWKLKAKQETNYKDDHQQRELCQAILHGVLLLIENEDSKRSPTSRGCYLQSEFNTGGPKQFVLMRNEQGLLAPVNLAQWQPVSLSYQEILADQVQLWNVENQQHLYLSCSQDGNPVIIQKMPINLSLPWMTENQLQWNLPALHSCDPHNQMDECQNIQSNNIQVQRGFVENQVLASSPSPQELHCTFDSEGNLPYHEQSFQDQETTDSTGYHQDQKGYYSSEEWQSSGYNYYSDSEEELQSSGVEEQNYFCQEAVKTIQDSHYNSETEDSDEAFQADQPSNAMLDCGQFQNHPDSDDQYWSDNDSCLSGWTTTYFVC
jgi:hypothetical protein